MQKTKADDGTGKLGSRTRLPDNGSVPRMDLKRGRGGGGRWASRIQVAKRNLHNRSLQNCFV